MICKTAAIIVNWNNFKDTAACIESLKRSSTKCKIIVVDNGSRNDEWERLGRIRDITLLRNGENIGFGRGNNIGIQWALSNTSCQYFFLLNNDATVSTDTIRKLEVSFNAHGDAGVVAPRIVFSENPDILWYGGGEISWWRGRARIPGFRGPANFSGALIERAVSFASGCAMAIKRTVLESLGGFDPRFFMYEEDVEFCLRLQQSGWSIWYIPDAIVLHKVQGSRRQKGEPFSPLQHPSNPQLPFFMYHMTKNRLLTMTFHATGWNAIKFWTYFPLHSIAKCIQFGMNRRWDGITAVGKGIRDYISVSKQPFVNESKKS